MRRNVIRLTESDIRGIVKNSVMKILKEDIQDDMFDNNIEEVEPEETNGEDYINEHDIAGIQAAIDLLSELQDSGKADASQYNIINDAIEKLEELIDQCKPIEI